MKILIDNGHVSDKPSKRSLDGRFLEWKYNRDIARRVTSELTALGRSNVIFQHPLQCLPT